MSTAAKADFTEQQLIDIAYVIINKTGKYQPYIREWSRLPIDQCTWANFKTQFRRAHQELKEAGDLTVRETQFHTANIVQEVIDGVQSVLNTPEPSSVDNNQVAIDHMANVAAQNQVLPQLMTQMAQLMQQMNSIQQQINTQASTTSTITQSSTSSTSRQNRPRTNTSHYCWSHGACAHTSAQCRSKKPGHKDTATFYNKLGGSTAYCDNAPSSTTN